MEQFNFSSKLTSIKQNVSSFLLCAITFRGPPQGSQLGPAFAKAATAPFLLSNVYWMLFPYSKGVVR
jgi:hypothetical protein